jgi:hypothetical protein
MSQVVLYTIKPIRIPKTIRASQRDNPSLYTGRPGISGNLQLNHSYTTKVALIAQNELNWYSNGYNVLILLNRTSTILMGSSCHLSSLLPCNTAIFAGSPGGRLLQLQARHCQDVCRQHHIPLAVHQQCGCTSYHGYADNHQYQHGATGFSGFAAKTSHCPQSRA